MWECRHCGGIRRVKVKDQYYCAECRRNTHDFSQRLDTIRIYHVEDLQTRNRDIQYSSKY